MSITNINPFQKPLEEYTNDLNYMEGYIHQQATILSRRLKQPYDVIKSKIEKVVEERFKEKTIRLYIKDIKTLDMEETTMSLTRFINTLSSENLTIAPSFTCYTKVDKDGNPWVAMQSSWTDVNKRSRNVFKEKSKSYEAIGDTVNQVINNTLNIAAKTKNNSLSGKSSLLKYPTSRHSTHYSLTSFTRNVTSSANTLSESIVMGNRLYYNPSDVIRHIASIISYSNYDDIKDAVDFYSLHIPTVEEIMEMVLYNTYYYWRNVKTMDKIKSYIESLTDMDRVAYLYTFDLYHLHKFNSKLVDSMLTALSRKYDTLSSDMDVVTREEDYKVNLLHHVCYDELKGMGIKHKEFVGKPIAKTLASTMLNINAVLEKSSKLIKAFFMSRVIPPNASNIKDAIRRAIVLSDTDSTVSFYYHFIIKRYGLFKLNNASIAYAASTSIFVSESIRNVLIQLGKNMNVDQSKMSEIDMKSEFMFSMFIPTSGSKHYIEKTIIKELIQKIDAISFHGVALKANKILKKFNNEKVKMVKRLIETVEKGENVNLSEVVEFIKKIEREIIIMIENADSNIFMFSDIKEASTYKIPMSSNYFHYELWKNVFAEKYGDVPEPPYLAMKLSVNLSSKKVMKESLDTIEDEGIRDRWIEFNNKYPKDKMTQVIVPYDIVKNNGIPKELFNIIDTNKLVTNIMLPFYTVMETVGISCRDGMLFIEQF